MYKKIHSTTFLIAIHLFYLIAAAVLSILTAIGQPHWTSIFFATLTLFFWLYTRLVVPILLLFILAKLFKKFRTDNNIKWRLLKLQYYSNGFENQSLLKARMLIKTRLAEAQKKKSKNYTLTVLY